MKKSADEIISSAYDKIGLDISKIVVMVLTFFLWDRVFNSGNYAEELWNL